MPIILYSLKMVTLLRIMLQVHQSRIQLATFQALHLCCSGDKTLLIPKQTAVEGEEWNFSADLKSFKDQIQH